MERVALARLVNEEIRKLAQRRDVPAEKHAYAWLCACGCHTMIYATLADFDASDGQVFAKGHPLDSERAEATAAFEREPDPAAVQRRVNQKTRRKLTSELARRLERQAMPNGPT